MNLERDFFWDTLRSMADMPRISEEDINDILEEESEFIESLEKEMKLVSSFDYHTLINELILCFKIALDDLKRRRESQAKAIRRTQSPQPEREVSTHVWSISCTAANVLEGVQNRPEERPFYSCHRGQ
jgi:SPX domain protein involved in polyphosphate accumulation